MREFLKNFFTTERAKMKDMTFREKAAYVWEYYKFGIIAVVVVIFILGGIVNTVWIHPPKKDFLQIAFYAGYVDDATLAGACAALQDALMTPEELAAKQISGSVFMTDSGDPQMDMSYQEKFAAMISARQLDLMILNDTDLDMWASQGMLAPINDYFSSETQSAVSGSLLQSTDDNGTKADFAVKLDGNKFFTDNGLPTDGLCLGVIVNTQYQDNVKRALDFIFNS